MATGYGFNSWAGFALETTYGTAATRTSWFRLMSVDIKEENPTKFVQMLGTSLDRHKVKMKRSVSGSLTIAVPYAGFGFILKHALGAVSTAGGSAPYTHTFTNAAALPLSMTIEINKDTKNDLYGGCKVTSFKVTAALEDYIQCELGIIGQVVTNASASTPTFPTDVFIPWTDAGTMSIGGSSYSLKMVEFEQTHELTDDRYFLGNQNRSEPKRKGGTVKVKAELELDSTTHAAAFRANTEADLSFVFGSSPTALTIAVADASYQSADSPVSDTGEIIESLEFEANLNDVTITLINGDSSY